MSEPVTVDQLEVHRVLMSRRFSKEQGVKANGETTLRAVDDMIASNVNWCAQPGGKTQTDAIDVLVRCAVHLKVACGLETAFWKAVMLPTSVSPSRNAINEPRG